MSTGADLGGSLAELGEVGIRANAGEAAGTAIIRIGPDS